MSAATKFLALGAFACIASCLAALALPMLSGGLAAFGWRIWGWETGAGTLFIVSAALAWLYLQRRGRARGCSAPKRESAEAAP